MVENYNVFVTVACRENRDKVASPMDINLHSLPRRLIELRTKVLEPADTVALGRQIARHVLSAGRYSL